MITEAPPGKSLTDTVAASLLQDVLLPCEAVVARSGDEIGPYRLLDKLGEGGFGVVWRAEQTAPVRREVALKMIKLGMDSREVLARFGQERQVLATMEHPHIAAMLDAGMAPDGRPFFVMEMVKGVPLTRYCVEKQMPLRERVLLFKAVCQGVQHAHQKGVIHRDLKPTNILVTEVDGQPVPKIIDFGVAKAIATRRLSSISLITRADVIIGTPLYMSPEQIDESMDVDTRSDVYALGALLYELLTGQPPFDAKTLSSSGQHEMRRIIREVQPVAPSRRALLKAKGLGRLEGQTGPPSFESYLSFSKDLDWVTLRALEKDPRRRYSSAAELAADLQRFLDHEPVSAHPPAAGYIAARWIRRHRAAFVAVSVSALALICGAGIALWQAREARQEKKVAEAQAARAIAAEASAKAESARAHQAASFVTTLLDNAAEEITKGRNPEALKLSLDRSVKALSSMESDPVLHDHLLDRLAGLYSTIGEWKTALDLMRTRVGVLARSHGDESAEARKAELVYLKRIGDHGTRASAPPQLAALKARVERDGGRGGKFWFDVMRELGRVSIKLDDGPAALAFTTEALVEAEKQKLRRKAMDDVQITRAAALEFTGDIDAALALLEKCRASALADGGGAERLAQIERRQLFALKSKGDHAQAARILRGKLDRAKAAKSVQPFEVTTIMAQLVEFESEAGQHDQAVAHAREALELARAVATGDAAQDHRAEIGGLLRGLSDAERAAGLHDEAIKHAREARASAINQGNKAEHIEALTCLARAHEAARHLDEAYGFFEECLKLRQLDSSNFKGQLYGMEELFRIRLDQGRHDDALALARQMWELVNHDPAGRADIGELGYAAGLCIKSWAGLIKSSPSALPPPELPAWTKAVENERALTKINSPRQASNR